jgi:hypothetical protein
MKTKRLRSRPHKRQDPLVTIPLVDDPFKGKSLEEWAIEQGAKPFDYVAFARSFDDIIPADEDMGEFVKEIYQART